MADGKPRDATASAASAVPGPATASAAALDPAPDPAAGPAPIGPEALKAFAHPLRMAMYRYLTAHGSATASQLARHTGESTGQTSYHLRQLERHGLIEDDPERAGSGRERWWRPAGFSLDPRTFDDPAAKLAAGVAMRGIMQERSDLLLDWFAAVEADPAHGWVDAALHQVGTAELTLEELSDLGARLARLTTEALDEAKRRKAAGETEGRRRVRVYLDAFPLQLED